jgi:hypothetical protein
MRPFVVTGSDSGLTPACYTDGRQEAQKLRTVAGIGIAQLMISQRRILL